MASVEIGSGEGAQKEISQEFIDAARKGAEMRIALNKRGEDEIANLLKSDIAYKEKYIMSQAEKLMKEGKTEITKPESFA